MKPLKIFFDARLMLVIGGCSVCLGGCISPDFAIPRPLQIKKEQTRSSGLDTKVDANTQRTTQVYATPSLKPTTQSKAGFQVPHASGEEASTTLMFDQLPLNTFIHAVFGNVLKRNVSVDEQITKRQDVVTLRTSTPQTPSQIFQTARMVLKSYGIAVSDYDGLVRVTPDNAQTGYAPEIRRGRALPDTPLPLRPIFHLVELQSVKPADVSTWLGTMFGNKLKVQDDNTRQAVMLSGQGDDVLAALEAIQVLDQPAMRGRSSVRIVPVFWSSDEMAKRLAEVLAAQGVNVTTQVTVPSPLVLLPINALNSLVVFASTQEMLDLALNWVRELDQPTTGRGTSGYFTYTCKFADADELAKTLQALMTGGGVTATANATGGSQTTTLTQARTSRVVVNKASNSLIIQGSPDEYNQWMGLLRELDRPAKAALISVTVAEVRLTDKEQLGIEWAMNQVGLGGSGYSAAPATLGNLGVDKIGGIVAKVINAAGDTRMLISALATSSKARILSNPSIVTRNGETATIQVGQEVPVVSSAQSNANTTGGILQTIQYRNTGVILKVRPIIHAGGRVELDVTQEVSSVADNQTGAASSPVFSTRKVETKLSVSDGNTVLMGGLMSQSDSGSKTGVPILKDIPLAGALFRSNTDGVDKTELIVMITPYVINDDFEARQITETFRGQMSFDRREKLSANDKSQAANPQPAKPSAPAEGTPGAERGVVEKQQEANQPYRGTPYRAPERDDGTSGKPAQAAAEGTGVAEKQRPEERREVVPLPGGGKGEIVTDNEVLESLKALNAQSQKKGGEKIKP